jgi:hypothetical protein
MPWWVASLLANVAIMGTEYVHRSVPAGTPWTAILLPWAAPLYAVAQYCLFKSYSGAPNWFVAWMMFAVANSVMRILVVHFTANEEVTNWWCVSLGVSTIMAGSFWVKAGLR